jgi:transposase InsO family protein
MLSFLMLVVSGWVHRHQLVVIEYLQSVNQLLKERLNGKRLRFTDAERALLARKAKQVGRKTLLTLDTLVTPDTLLRWHRQFVARKWNFAHRRGPGRPGVMRQISTLICRMANENPGWGYTRIQGALSNVGHQVGRGTVANVLKRNGIEPSPERNKRTRWSTFLKAHWPLFAASDFLTVEVWTGKGLVTHYIWFAISLADRAVQILGITTRPDERWMLQMARNLLDCESGLLRGKRYLIIDRDTKFTAQFRRLINDSGTQVIRLPPRSPNLNAYAERFVRSIKSECLERMLFVGQGSLRRAVTQYSEHYHTERNHQGLENRLVRPISTVAASDGSVRRRERLGGMLNFHYRRAA